MEEILDTPGEMEAMLSNYDTPSGKGWVFLTVLGFLLA
jgi:hypothetical protein